MQPPVEESQAGCRCVRLCIVAGWIGLFASFVPQPLPHSLILCLMPAGRGALAEWWWECRHSDCVRPACLCAAVTGPLMTPGVRLPTPVRPLCPVRRRTPAAAASSSSAPAAVDPPDPPERVDFSPLIDFSEEAIYYGFADLPISHPPFSGRCPQTSFGRCVTWHSLTSRSPTSAQGPLPATAREPPARHAGDSGFSDRPGADTVHFALDADASFVSRPAIFRPGCRSKRRTAEHEEILLKYQTLIRKLEDHKKSIKKVLVTKQIRLRANKSMEEDEQEQTSQDAPETQNWSSLKQSQPEFKLCPADCSIMSWMVTQKISLFKTVVLRCCARSSPRLSHSHHAGQPCAALGPFGQGSGRCPDATWTSCCRGQRDDQYSPQRPPQPLAHLDIRGSHDCPARGPRCVCCCLRPVMLHSRAEHTGHKCVYCIQDSL